MSQPKFVNSTFDPSLCPLLAGLSADEQRLKMETDPVIRACIRSTEDGGRYACMLDTSPSSSQERAPAPVKRTRRRVIAGQA